MATAAMDGFSDRHGFVSSAAIVPRWAYRKGLMSKEFHILIVDDEPGIRAALQNWFRAKGYRVDTASDGLEAIQRCRETVYDLVTMDLEMPRMGGLEAMPAILQIQPSLPIVVLTGFVRNEAQALSAGAVRVLGKPLRLSHLEEEIRGILLPE